MELEKSIISFDYTGPEAEEILRNLNTLYGTAAGSVPLDREFGLDHEFLDYPIDVAQNMVALEITEKTELYEPRVEVIEVTFKSDAENGKLIPTVLIARAENVDDLEEGDE